MHITDQQDLAARKHCISLHRDLGVKSLTELRAHAMTWAELNATEKRLKTTSSNLMDKMDGADDETTEGIGRAIDGLLGAFDAIKFESSVLAWRDQFAINSLTVATAQRKIFSSLRHRTERPECGKL